MPNNKEIFLYRVHVVNFTLNVKLNRAFDKHLVKILIMHTSYLEGDILIHCLFTGVYLD